MLHPKPSSRRSGLIPLVAGACFAALLLLTLAPRRAPERDLLEEHAEHADKGDAAAKKQATKSEPAAAEAAKEDSPWPKVRVINDLETLWEVPAKPRGVLFVAHGCSHQGSDWWPPSDRCGHCVGLPEEMLVTNTALKRGYAVIAITSFNRDSKCWHNTQPSKSNDLQRVPTILKQVIEEEGLEELPLFILGASSGGGFVLRLAQLMPEVEGVTCQINPVNPDVFRMEKGRSFPPVLFVHMALRDPEKAATVEVALEILEEQGVPAEEVRIDPQPVTAEFMQRSPQIDAKMAKAIVEALADNHFLDKEGCLVDDPRSSGYVWRALLQPLVGDLSLEADVSQITELLNVAYARHELVSDTTDVSLAWMEARGKKRVQSLMKG